MKAIKIKEKAKKINKQTGNIKENFRFRFRSVRTQLKKLIWDFYISQKNLMFDESQMKLKIHLGFKSCENCKIRTII